MKFVKGMDLSTLLELEKCGARYYVDGTEDVYKRQVRSSVKNTRQKISVSGCSLWKTKKRS